MNLKTFISKLLLSTAISAAFIFGLSFFPSFQPFSLLGWISILFFVIWSVIMFFVSQKAAKNENKNVFTSAILGFTFAKLFLSGGIVLVYFSLAAPESRLFVLPFFGIYLIYTIFETQFMMKLGKTQYTDD